MDRIDCAVIGAGVVGLAIARSLALAGREVVILEAEHAIGTHTSARNSEVIHAGLSYAPGSLKGRLCVAGKAALYAYCAERGIGHRRIGKLIVAVEDAELPELDNYLKLGAAHGVTDLRLIGAAEAREMEPEVACVGALHSPSTGIVDSHALMLSYLGDAERAGAALALHSRVLAARPTADGIVLEVGGAEETSVLCGTVVNAAGLGAQAVASRIEGRRRFAGRFRQVPFRQQHRGIDQRVARIGAEAGQQAALAGAIDLDQHVGRPGIELALVAARRQNAGIGVVAEILQQQEALLGILGEDLRRAEAERDQVPADPHEGPHIFLRWWGIHDDRRTARPAQAEILAERGIARQQAFAGIAPAGAAHELGAQLVAFRFHQSGSLLPGLRAGLHPRPTG